MGNRYTSTQRSLHSTALIGAANQGQVRALTSWHCLPSDKLIIILQQFIWRAKCNLLFSPTVCFALGKDIN